MRRNTAVNASSIDMATIV